MAKIPNKRAKYKSKRTKTATGLPINRNGKVISKLSLRGINGDIRKF